MMHSESSKNKLRIAQFTAVFAVILLTVMGIHTAQHFDDGSIESAANTSPSHESHRKLLNHAAMEKKQENEKIKGKGKGKGKARVKPDRIWGDKCSKSDIVISQGATESLPNGIPTYTVEIMNVCTSGYDISDIHLNCGWFSSARLINPRVFKRLDFDDCLVNDGKPLSIGRTLSFQYANTFPYPLSVWSVRC